MKTEIRRLLPLSLICLTTVFMLVACSSPYRVSDASASDARSVVRNWPSKPKDAADKMIDKYGAPDDVTESMLVWHNKGSWKKISVMRDEIPHDFPKPHTDFLMQTIDYRVPLGKFDDLARYDGSVIAERTKGTLSARCDKEEMNYLALNLAHDVATGRKTIEQARFAYARIAQKFMNGESDPYLQGLQFRTRTDTGDRDTSLE
jgi:hypothetical protein